MAAYTTDKLEFSPPDHLPHSSLRAASGSVVLDYLRALVAARDCAAALEAGQRPSDASLRTLGIDPAAYAEVRLV